MTQSGGATFGGAVGAGGDRIGTVALTNTTGTVQFSDNLFATSLTAAANGYSVSMLGASTDVTNAVTFNNTGTVTFGDGGDALLFTGGVVHTAGANVVNGNITTTDQALNLDNNATGTNVNGNSTLAAGDRANLVG